MPRAIWSGAISFGLVNIPVKLYSAVQRKTVRFHQLDQEDKQRIQQKRVNPRTGEEVPYENLVKGYEIGPDRYVVITPEELDSIQPEKTRMIDIVSFADLDQIDPIFYDHPYYLVPDTGADKAYRLLLDAMTESGKVAVGRVVLRTKEYLVAIRPRDAILTMETMLFSDEVISPDKLDERPSDGKAKTSQKELQMAQQLIDSLAEDFEPESYRDEYRERVLEMIERKAEGEEIVVEAPSDEPKEVPDLMAALEQSIAGAKGQGGGKRAKPKRSRATSGDGKPASRKKITAKKN
ncbi:MAG TPA: Ku protein [Thermoleophilaceae bacterium]|nr:Ku protein [Thermoleophilaceae bacterium]